MQITVTCRYWGTTDDGVERYMNDYRKDGIPITERQLARHARISPQVLHKTVFNMFERDGRENELDVTREIQYWVARRQRLLREAKRIRENRRKYPTARERALAGWITCWTRKYLDHALADRGLTRTTASAGQLWIATERARRMAMERARLKRALAARIAKPAELIESAKPIETEVP